MSNDVNARVLTWGNEHRNKNIMRFTWLQKSPMLSWKMVDFSRLILISLEMAQRFLVICKSDGSSTVTQVADGVWYHYCCDEHKASIPVRVTSISTTHVHQFTHCSWMCCWKLGRLRSLRARRRIFFSSSVSFFCPIFFNLAAASSKHEGQYNNGLVRVLVHMYAIRRNALEKNETVVKQPRHDYYCCCCGGLHYRKQNKWGFKNSLNFSRPGKGNNKCTKCHNSVSFYKYIRAA